MLQRQLRDGDISEQEFADRMAEIDDAALNRSIRKAKVDLNAAKLAEEMLPQQQAQQQQALELQAQQLQLQQQLLPLQQQQLELSRRQNELDQQKNQSAGAQNQLEIERNLIQAQKDQIALNKAALEAQKQQANDIRAITQEILRSIEEGRKAKFDPLNSQPNQARCGRGGDWPDEAERSETWG